MKILHFPAIRDAGCERTLPRVSDWRFQSRQIRDPQHLTPLLEDVNFGDPVERVNDSRLMRVRLVISACVSVEAMLAILHCGSVAKTRFSTSA
jgi:hypothetical protein